MAARTPPTVRPAGQSTDPRTSAATPRARNRGTLAPTPAASRVPRRGHVRHGGRILAGIGLGLVVVFIGVLAVSASASPKAPSSAPPPPSFSIAVPTLPACNYPGQTQCTTNPNTPPPPPASTTAPTTTPTGTPTPTTPAPPTTGTTTPTPCAGEDCIPQPTTPPTSGDQHAPGADEGSGSGDSECGITDVGACITESINGMFAGLVQDALSPILELIGRTVLSTPTIASLPGIGELWNHSFELVVAAYGLLILAGGIVVMGHQSVQTRYSIKEIGPRIPLAFMASTLSLFFADKMITVANALTLGVLGGGTAPALGDTFADALGGIASGGLFLILIGLVLVVVGLALLIVYVFRVAITLILIISGPLFLACHALPHTDPLARWWWRATAATLSIQFVQALVLIAGVRTFLSGGVHLFGSTGSALGMLIAAIALFYILFRIPFWLLSAVRIGGGGRSLLGGLLRAYVAARAFGMVAHRGRGHGGGHGGGGGGRAPRRTGGNGQAAGQAGGHGRGHGAVLGGGVATPYARARATRTGQYMLPLPGLRRTHASATPRPARTAPPSPPSTSRGRQLVLPLGDSWPEHRPVLGRDGQYRLPLDVQRVSPPPPPGSTSQPGSGGQQSGSRRGRQLEFRFDPYKGNRPTRSGQYPLPFDGIKHAPGVPPQPAVPPNPGRRRTRARQLELPFDPYKGNRPTRGGQYPLPFEDLHHEPPPPTPAAPSQPVPSQPSRSPAGKQLRLPLDLPKRSRRSPKSGGKS